MSINTIELIVWSLFAAITVAVLYAFFMQKSVSGLAKKLIDSSALSKDCAKTLSELGYKDGIASKVTAFFAAGGSYLARCIVKVGRNDKNDKNTGESDLLFVKKEPLKYYIPEEKVDKVFNKHLNDKMSPKYLILSIAVLLILALVAGTVINFLMSTASNAFSGIGNAPVGTESESDSLLDEQEKLTEEEETAKEAEAEGGEESEDESAEKPEENADENSPGGAQETTANEETGDSSAETDAAQ